MGKFMQLDPKTGLPTAMDLEAWLNLSVGTGVDDLIDKALLLPLKEFLNRPSKHFRGQLVQLGFNLVNEKGIGEPCVKGAMKVLEAIHAASLVVDDIQDNSELRRGLPTLHRTHGLAIALNSANWLYFWPLELIQGWDLPQEMKNQLILACNRALIKAHSGQALDVGTPISLLPKERVKAICLASLELKTGALTALALELGAILAGCQTDKLNQLSRFGIDFGVALQMFDDIGNVSEKTPRDPKRFEDLKGDRPSWVWAAAADQLSEIDYSTFIEKVRTLPEEAELSNYLTQSTWLVHAKTKAAEYLDKALKQLEARGWNSKAMEELNVLAYQLKRSYE